MNKLLWIWQLPQSILGLILIKVFDGVRYQDYWISDKIKAGISLGDYIIVPLNTSKITLTHERAHRRQSLYLEIFYLLVIGLPSFIASRTITDYHKYYNFYTEKSADKIAGIKR